MKLLIDANLSPRLARALAKAGHDVVHAFGIGLGSAADATILEHAWLEQRIVVSSDSDFGAFLAQQHAAKPSFVLLRHMNDTTVEGQTELLLSVFSAASEELDAGAVVTIGRGRIRTRRLPFQR